MTRKNFIIFCLFPLFAFTACAGQEFVHVHVPAVLPTEETNARASLPPPIEHIDPALTEYDPNGHPKNGVYKTYTRSGQLLLERHYRKGIRQGSQDYYSLATGELASHYLYEEGELTTFIEYYPDGQPKMELELIKEKEWRMRTFTPDGHLINESWEIPQT